MNPSVPAACLVALGAGLLFLSASPASVALSAVSAPQTARSQPIAVASGPQRPLRAAGVPRAERPSAASARTIPEISEQQAKPLVDLWHVLAAPIAFVTAAAAVFALRRAPAQPVAPMTCLGLAGMSDVPARPNRRSTSLQAGFFQNLFVTPKYEEDGDSDEPITVDSDTPEMAALRKAVLQGTFIAGDPLQLAYDAQRDGWTASAFHRRVDERGPAVLIGRTEEGVLFGGFNGVGWVSLEDYRDTNSVFLFHFPNGKVDGPVEILPKVGSPAIYDSSAQGPTFGADGLRIPLGKALQKGRGKAASAPVEVEGGNQTAISRLGSYYAAREDGEPSLFGDREKTTLTELRVYVAA